MAQPVFTMGVDIGSATSKCVVLADGKEIVSHSVVAAGTGTSGPQKAIAQALETAKLELSDMTSIAATGYGRNVLEIASVRSSELTCHAKGAARILPGVRTVIDIGGQDAKVLSLTEDGIMTDFVMNDKCAAGTGRFLEVMARIIDAPITELAGLDELAQERLQISSTCTVFAESEVISKLSNNVKIPDLVAGIHDSVAIKTASLVKRLGLVEPVLMTGGVSQNQGVVKALERLLGVHIETSSMSQIAGALGAAITAYEKI